MTRKSIIVSNGVSRPKGSYSHAVVAGDYVFVSGLGPVDVKRGDVVEGGIKKQTIQTLKNIQTVLASVELALSDVVKVNVFLRKIEDFEEFNSAYSSFFKTDSFPARTTVQCTIPNRKALIEMDVIAYTDS